MIGNWTAKLDLHLDELIDYLIICLLVYWLLFLFLAVVVAFACWNFSLDALVG